VVEGDGGALALAWLTAVDWRSTVGIVWSMTTTTTAAGRATMAAAVTGRATTRRPARD
jgi:hypothetical protein